MAPTRIGVYQVVSALGDGPRGPVHLCKDSDGHRVAARIFPATTDPEGFLKTAGVLKALTAHHLALVEDFGIQEGRPFLANELVEGEPLASWLGEPHAPGDQLKLIEGLLDALHAAHGQGIVHARVQPSNVRVLPDGECRLLDLGVSTFAPLARASPTSYCAPELAEGGAASVKNDIYSAGVVCYEVLAGRPPFDPSEASGPTQSLRAVRSDLPRDLSDAVMACLDKDPEWRPKDLGYLLQVVRQLREAGLPKGARGATLPAPRPTGRAAPVPAARVRPRAPDRSGPPLLPIALGLVALAAGGYLLWSRRSAPPPVGPRPRPMTASPLPVPLRPDVPAPGLPPPEPPPEPPATPAAPSPSTMTTPTPAASTPAPRAATPPRATPAPARTPALPTPEVKPEPARPTPTPAALVIPTSAPPAPTPSVPATVAPDPALAAAEPPAAPATLTTVVPRVLKNGATGIVDVHGLGLRSDHQIRLLKGRDPAPGFTLVRQRRVSDSLIQAVVQVDAAAASGLYTLVLADRQGGLSNPLPLEVAR